MSNLIKELGAGYMNDWFHGSYFIHEGLLCKFDQATAQYLRAFRWSNGEESAHATSIPADLIKGFSFFKFPPLGYRNLITHEGPCVIKVNSSRSARRGLSRRCIRVQALPAYTLIMGMSEMSVAVNEVGIMRSVFLPQYTPFAEGIKEVLEGRSLGFAVNHMVAVAVDPEARREPHIGIYFRDKRAGFVSSSGEVVLTNKVMSRSALREALL